MGKVRGIAVLAGTTLCVAVAIGSASARQSATLRLHGMVEPVRSHPVAAPRLTGTPFQLVIVKLATGGARVKRGDLLVEFDRTSQIKAARDREYEYRDLLAQLEKKRADQFMDKATRQADFSLAQNALRRAELDLLGVEMLPGITAEKNQQILDEAKATVAQLEKTNHLKDRSAATDLRMQDNYSQFRDEIDGLYL